MRTEITPHCKGKRKEKKSELEELKRQNAELKQELEKASLENENNRMREEIELLRKWNLPSPWYPYGWWPIFC